MWTCVHICVEYYLSDYASQLRQMLREKDIRRKTKARLVKAMVFLVIMYGCESWTIKKLRAKDLMLLNCGVGDDA